MLLQNSPEGVLAKHLFISPGLKHSFHTYSNSMGLYGKVNVFVSP